MKQKFTSTTKDRRSAMVAFSKTGGSVKSGYFAFYGLNGRFLAKNNLASRLRLAGTVCVET